MEFTDAELDMVIKALGLKRESKKNELERLIEDLEQNQKSAIDKFERMMEALKLNQKPEEHEEREIDLEKIANNAMRIIAEREKEKEKEKEKK